MTKIDPEKERQRLMSLCAAMSDLELQKVGKNPESLTDWAFEAFREEMNKRGLDWSGKDMPLPSQIGRLPGSSSTAFFHSLFPVFEVPSPPICSCCQEDRWRSEPRPSSSSSVCKERSEPMLGLMMCLEEALGGSAGTLFLVQIHQP